MFGIYDKMTPYMFLA